jgi:hypothetical protein
VAGNGEWKKIAVYAVEALGIFSIGEIVSWRGRGAWCSEEQAKPAGRERGQLLRFRYAAIAVEERPSGLRARCTHGAAALRICPAGECSPPPRQRSRPCMLAACAPGSRLCSLSSRADSRSCPADRPQEAGGLPGEEARRLARARALSVLL